MKKFERFIEKFNYLFTFPVLILFLLVSWYNGVNNEKLKTILSFVVTSVFIVYLIVCAIKLGNKFFKTEILWPFIVSFVLLIMSLVMSFAENDNLSGTISIIGILFFELFALYVVIHNCFSKNTNINKVLIFSSIFVILGYVTIYKSTYNVDDNDLFNSLIAVFSALIGGGITLAGVAWTINNQNKEKVNTERMKYKPQFMFRNTPFFDDYCENEDIYLGYALKDRYSLKELKSKKINDDEQIYCIDNIYIKNTDHSNFKIKNIYLDGKDSFCRDKIIIKRQEFYVTGFYTIQNKDYLPNLELIIEDMVGNTYLYKFKFKTKTNGCREGVWLQEVELDEINEKKLN